MNKCQKCGEEKRVVSIWGGKYVCTICDTKLWDNLEKYDPLFMLTGVIAIIIGGLLQLLPFVIAKVIGAVLIICGFGFYGLLFLAAMAGDHTRDAWVGSEMKKVENILIEHYNRGDREMDWLKRYARMMSNRDEDLIFDDGIKSDLNYFRGSNEWSAF